MKKESPLASALAAGSLDPDRLKDFANHIARFESNTGLKLKRVLINGIPPFERVATAEFDVPRKELGSVVGKLYSEAEFGPSIMINGIPAWEHVQLSMNYAAGG